MKAKMVEEFHKAFGIEKPDAIDSEFLNLRYMLLDEEFEEYRLACAAAAIELNSGHEVSMANKMEMLDAMGDMMYIIYGTAELLGWDVDEAFKIIHESNMSKLDEDGKPIINGENGVMDSTRPPGKVLKSNKFKEPELKELVL